MHLWDCDSPANDEYNWMIPAVVLCCAESGLEKRASPPPSRTREDTVRQIVAGLTGDTEGCIDLANELSRADPVTLEMQDSEDDGSDPEDWLPDPTDAVRGQYAGTPEPSAPVFKNAARLAGCWS